MPSAEHCRKEYAKISQKRGKNVKYDDLRVLLEQHGWALHRIAQNNHYLFAHPNYEGFVTVVKKSGGDVLPCYCRDALQAIAEVANYE